MKPCAFRDCGDPDCHLCRLARIPTSTRNASLHEPMRDDARAELPVKKTLSPNMPKRKHRVGPHR